MLRMLTLTNCSKMRGVLGSRDTCFVVFQYSASGGGVYYFRCGMQNGNGSAAHWEHGPIIQPLPADTCDVWTPGTRQGHRLFVCEADLEILMLCVS